MTVSTSMILVQMQVLALGLDLHLCQDRWTRVIVACLLYTTVSLLSRLKSPTLADLARKRKVKTNPPKGIKKGKGVVAADPKNVFAADRVKSYPDEYLIVNYVLDHHIASQKHLKGKEKIASREKRERDIAESLK